MTKDPTPVDREAGKRLRALRIERGLSQTEVANHLGLTFQQVQKYEKGTNRMGASRLAALASLLGVQPADFFAHVASDQRDGPVLIENNQERRMLVAFRNLTAKQRVAMIELMASCVQER